MTTSLFPWITNGPLIAVQVMSGLSVGMFLFLLSVGMSLIFGVTRIVNLAHGSFYMVGAYLMAALIEVLPDSPVSFWIALVLGLSPLVAVGLWLVFYRTRWGMLVRAATIDREMLGALGVDVSKLYTQVFAFGSWLAGLGGALAAPTVAVALGMDADVLINAFVVVVIGGLGSFAGTLISALLVGELQSFGILIFPGVSIVLPFALMAVVLMIRPWGLLGEPEE